MGYQKSKYSSKLVAQISTCSGVTPLKCGKIYDMDIFCKFRGEYDSEKNMKIGHLLSNV